MFDYRNMGFRPMSWIDCWCRDFAVNFAILTNHFRDYVHFWPWFSVVPSHTFSVWTLNAPRSHHLNHTQKLWCYHSGCYCNKVVVTTGVIRRAKLQSNRRHQQTNIQLFTARMPMPFLEYKLSVMVHRCLSGCASQYLATYCVLVTSIAARQHLCSAVRHQLVVPSHRLNTYGRRAFAIAGPTTWNSLPTHLRRVENSTAPFGQLLKTHLFSEYTSVYSALGVSTIMHYTNRRFTYLLTYFLSPNQQRQSAEGRI